MSKRNRERKFQDLGKVRAISQEVEARLAGPAKRTWSKHDLRHIKPLTERQRDAMQSFMQGNDIAMLGTAGTGKSMTAVYLAANELVTPDSGIEQIIIVRAPVQAVDQGFLPGTLEEKQAPYEAPYAPLFAHLFGHATTYERMKEEGILQFVTPSFLRGVTFTNAVVILEEVQNCAFEHIDTVMTRSGRGSRIIVTGDTRQLDLNRTHGFRTGVDQFVQVARRMSKFDIVEFTKHDIVRDPRVRAWIEACEDLSSIQQLKAA